MGKRDIEKHIKFNDAEYEIVCRRAAKLNMRIGTYIRKISVQGSVKVYDFDKVDDVHRAMNRIGVNINQIVHLANSTHSVYQKDVEGLQNQFKELKSVVENWLLPFEPEDLS